MEIISGIDNFPDGVLTCVTVGTFDGLHIGHQAVLKRLKETALEKGLKSAVVTFSPHPRQVLFPEGKVCFILSQEEKIEAFRKTGVDYLVVHPFSAGFAALSAEEFFKELLCKKMGMKHLVKGFNNHFGRDRISKAGEIEKYGLEAGFGVTQIEKLDFIPQYPASSTEIRRLIHEGGVEKASEILGYDFFITGIVVHGKHIGTSIGFPTANIVTDETDKIIPKNGVYAAFTFIDGTKYPVMLNIGNNPTVNAEVNGIFLEAHILDFSGNLYSRKLKIVLLKRIRDEKKFPSLDDLKRQLSEDKRVTAEMF